MSHLGIWRRSQSCGGARMIKRTLGCVALCGWLMASGSLQAHHSLAGLYDMKRETELSGSVEKIQFTNPHGSLVVGVKNPDGSTTEWVMTPRTLRLNPNSDAGLLPERGNCEVYELNH